VRASTARAFNYVSNKLALLKIIKSLNMQNFIQKMLAFIALHLYNYKYYYYAAYYFYII